MIVFSVINYIVATMIAWDSYLLLINGKTCIYHKHYNIQRPHETQLI